MLHPPSPRTVAALAAAILTSLALSVSAGTPIAQAVAPASVPTDPAQFTNPISDAWDPSIVTDGGDYFLVGTSLTNELVVRTSPTLAGLRTAPTTTVWTGPSSGLGCCRLWSPTFSKIDGTWWIHLSVTNENATSSAIYALEGTSTDPMGPYTYKGVVKSWNPGDPYYWERAIVGPSVTELPDGSIWLSSTTFGFYIQEMLNPWTLKPGSSMAVISEGEPTLTWEGGTLEISRPFIRTVDGVTRVFVPYSSENHVEHRTSGAPCWSWCVGMFINTDGDLDNPASWTKASQPVFAGGPQSGLYRAFALSTFKSPDQSEDWAIFNANDAPGTDFGERDTFAQRLTFDASGYPVFGSPVAMGAAQDVPSGETGSPSVILPGDTLLNEDFATTSAWTPLTGSWSPCSGQYCAGSGDNLAVTGETRWSDYMVQAKITPTSQPNGSGINVVARAQDANNFYAVELLRDAAGVEKWIIVQRIGGTYTILDSGIYNWDANKTYWLRISVNADKIAAIISLDGVRWTELGESAVYATADTSNSGLNYGRAGLRSWGGTAAQFDEVLVIASRPTYGFYASDGWPGLIIDAGANQPNPNEGYCVNIWNEYCSGGYTLTTSNSISTSGVANALPEVYYKTERWNDSQPATTRNDGAFRYAVPSLTPSAGYVVRLHFAEIHYTTTNQRRFDVKINGDLVLDEFDKIAVAGGANKAVVRTYSATADKFGHILIEFLPGQTAGVDHNPTVSALEILPTSVRLNMGSASGVGEFGADPAGTTGSVLATVDPVSTAGVAGAGPAALYQSERYGWGSPGDFHTIIGGLAPGADYKAVLHFAEIHYSSTGQRAFNVDINGTRVLTNFDKVAEAGGARIAIVRAFPTQADSAGQIDLHFTQGTVPGVDGNPTVSGVEIVTLS